MPWYVVRYNAKGYEEIMSTLTQSPTITMAIEGVTQQLQDRGIDATMVGAYRDDDPPPFGPHPIMRGQPRQPTQHTPT